MAPHGRRCGNQLPWAQCLPAESGRITHGLAEQIGDVHRL